MKLGKALRIIEKVLTAEDPSVRRIPVLLLGSPGIGKTAGIRYLAQKHGYDFVQELISRKRPEYLEGIMVPSTSGQYDGNRIAKFVATDLYRKITRSDKVVVLFDELTTAPPSILNAALTILSDYEVAGNKLEHDVVFIAAGNTVSTGTAYVEPLRASVSTRFLVLNVEPDFEYLVEEGLLHKLYAPEVVAYLLYKPQHYFSLAQEDVVGDTTAVQITTPRGWELVSRLLKHTIVTEELLRGIIGTVAGDFHNFLTQYNVKSVQNKKDEKEVPEPLRPYWDYLKKISRG